MKHATLKEAHLARLLEIKEAEETAQLFLEILDRDELRNATRILKKLGAIKKAADTVPALQETLGKAIKDAADEVNEFTGGGIGALLKKATTAIKQKFGAKVGDNPILKSLTLLNALERGLADAVDLIENAMPDFDATSDKSIKDQAPDEKAINNLKRSLSKAFVPEGFYSKLKSVFGGGGVPYIDDVSKVVDAILEMPGKNLSTLVKAATTGPSSEEAANSLKSTLKGDNKTTASGTEVKKVAPQPVKSVDALATAVAAGQSEEKGKSPDEAVQAAQNNPKSVVKQLVDYVAKQSGKSADVVNKVLNALLKKGKLRTQFAVAEGVTTLNMKDVVDAQIALLECKGSSLEWVEILFEGGAEARRAKRRKAQQAKQTLQQTKQDPPQQQEPVEKDSDQQKQDEKPSEDKDKSERSESKNSSVIKLIQNDLRDVEVKDIEAVLDALPDYLKAEHVKLFLSRVI